MIGRPAVIARVQGGSPIPPQEAIVAPGASYAVARHPIASDQVPTGKRLWKCRRYGNHRTVSTAPWKSRKEREIPTFPQPITLGSQEDDEEEEEDVTTCVTHGS